MSDIIQSSNNCFIEINILIHRHADLYNTSCIPFICYYSIVTAMEFTITIFKKINAVECATLINFSQEANMYDNLNLLDEHFQDQINLSK